METERGTSMISPVSNYSGIYMPGVTSTPIQPAGNEAAMPKDSVHLSPQAQTAASGDIDHDGDSR
jgi:hypothetical protein